MIRDIDYEEDFTASMDLHKRKLSDDQLRKFEGYAAEIFTAFGMDLHTPATADTPRRFIRALFDATDGYDGDPKLLKVFDTECRGGPDCRLSQVIEGPIQFYRALRAPCAALLRAGLRRLHRPRAHHRHLQAHPPGAPVRPRFTVQERIGQQIADTLEAMLEPHGVAVYLEAHHLCMQMRGVRETSPLTRTTFWRGDYDDNPALRSEFFTACGLQR